MSEIEALAAAIAKTMRPPCRLILTCGGPKECASFFKCSEMHFVKFVKTHPKFPRPISVPLSKPGKDGKVMRMHDRWKAMQVIEYADSCQVF